MDYGPLLIFSPIADVCWSAIGILIWDTVVGLMMRELDFCSNSGRVHMA